MTCAIHVPTSIADFAAILQACGGQDWANLALLGLLVVLLAMAAVVGLFLVVRTVVGR